MALPLLDIARLMDNPDFRWRVVAATAIKAKEEFKKGAGTVAAQQQSFRFATAILTEPTVPEMSMIAMCALDEGIGTLIQQQPEVSNIPDTEIYRAVTAEWPNVARKY